MAGTMGWPLEPSTDDLCNAVLLAVDLGLVEGDPTLDLLRSELRSQLRVEGEAAPAGHDMVRVK